MTSQALRRLPETWTQAEAERYRDRRGLGYYCPACRQKWFDPRSLRRHMSRLHHMCRFCPRAYIRVDQHERRSHTIEHARAAGACEGRR